MCTHVSESFPYANPAFQPGPYPVTKAEREAAAARYGLHPDDYEPYPDDGHGLGDYPMFKPFSAPSKDPYELYTDESNGRNFGEVVS